jgi:hypothetical protein
MTTMRRLFTAIDSYTLWAFNTQTPLGHRGYRRRPPGTPGRPSYVLCWARRYWTTPSALTMPSP